MCKFNGKFKIWWKFCEKIIFLVKSNWIRHELYILSLNLTLGISFSHINTWIVSFYPKNLFLSKFSSNFELFFRFTQITKVRFIDVIIPLRSISTNVSNCIVLNFMYTKFQVSSSRSGVVIDTQTCCTFYWSPFSNNYKFCLVL